MKRTSGLSLAVIAATVAVAAPATVVPTAGAAAAAAECGVGSYDKAFGYTYKIVKLKNVSCGEAKAAAKGINDLKVCKAKWTLRGWTVRNTGGLEAKFTKGKKSFVAYSEGAC